MTALQQIRDLLGHQGWADAQHWRAIVQHEAAREDEAVRRRLHHLHLVQRSFAWVVGPQTVEFVISKPDDFNTLDDLKTIALAAYADSRRLSDTLDDTALDREVVIPWFKQRPLTLSVGQALTQCAMHSQWHRGQNAVRLRELGGEPPTVDLIVWYLLGRPVAEWDWTYAPPR